MVDHPYKIAVEAERRLLWLRREAKSLQLVPTGRLRSRMAQLMRNLAEHLEPEPTAPVVHQNGKAF